MSTTAAAPSVTTADQIDAQTIQSYREHGFARVRNLLTPAEVERYREAALVASRTRPDHHQGAIFTQTVNVWPHDPVLRELSLSTRIGAIAEKLAGVPLRMWHDHILIKQPHNQAATEFHQDQPYWPHRGTLQTVSAWIALCDVPVERGCMSFLPGSHRRTDLGGQRLNDPRSLFTICPELEWTERVTIPLRAGDCTFHHGRCAHMATANNTDEPRVAHIVILMDRTTRFDGRQHVVTNQLGLQPGDLLAGELFPTVDEFAARGGM